MKKHVHGGNVYQYEGCLDFSANCNPLGTPEGVIEAAVRSLARIKDYPQVGYEPLREALAEYEGVKTDQVICGNGAAELIFSLCRAIRPGHGMLAVPSFAEYEQALLSVDCQVEHVLLKKEEGFVLGEDFVQALHRELDVVFLCNPNNPTGLLIDGERLKEILKICREFQILLVVDECFLDFVREPQAHTLKNVLEDFPNLFLLKAFTKRYAMAGLRLGYGLTANQELLREMELVTQPWNISSVAEAAGIAALKEQAYVEEGRRLVFEERALLKKALEEMGLKVYPSQANYLFFEGPEDFFEQAVREKILIRDCSNYQGLTRGFYRIAVKNHEENQALLQAFRRILEEGKERRKTDG